MKIFMSILLLFIAFLSYGQANIVQTATFDSVAIFKFQPRKEVFLLSHQSNKAELKRLYTWLDRYKTEIANGNMMVYVNSYCASFGKNRKKNSDMALLRGSRMKTKLITEKRLKTKNILGASQAVEYEGMQDVIAIAIRNPLAEKPTAGIETKPEIKPEVKQTVQTPKVQSKPKVVNPIRPQPVNLFGSEKSSGGVFTLRTNLLYWLTGVPNAGAEWRPSGNVGILLNMGWNHWNWQGEERHYRLWAINPEVRWYLGQEKRWFIGGEFHTGQYNFKFGDTGRQGPFSGAGVTSGYRLYLSPMFDMDFSLGLGYTTTKYDEYTYFNEVNIKKQTGLTKKIWGPTQVGISLVLKLGGNKE